MGRKNTKDKLTRSSGSREPRTRILIVSEGTKTEPNYFKEIRAELRLPAASIIIEPSEGTEPLSVVQSAEKLFLYGKKGSLAITAKAFDEVYVVFDRDDHPYYAQALAKAGTLDLKYRNEYKKPVRFFATPSNPCFELWLLLHFTDIRSLVHRNEIIKNLKNYIKNYEKSSNDIYSQTSMFINDAISRAKNININSSPLSDNSPYTEVVTLVERLFSIKKKSV